MLFNLSLCCLTIVYGESRQKKQTLNIYISHLAKNKKQLTTKLDVLMLFFSLGDTEIPVRLYLYW